MNLNQKKQNILVSLGLQILALAFCLISVQQARAGLSLYQAEQAFQQGRMAEAAQLSEAGLGIEPFHPQLLDLRSQSLWRLYTEAHNPALLEKALKAYQLLFRQIPEHPRGWFYAALIKLEIAKRSLEGVTPKDWSGIKIILRIAGDRDPESAWANFLIAKLYISQKQHLTPEETAMILNRLRKALKIHDSNQPSPYLAEALEMVWDWRQNHNDLLMITPDDAFSQNELRKFIERRGLTEYSEEFNDAALAVKT